MRLGFDRMQKRSIVALIIVMVIAGISGGWYVVGKKSSRHPRPGGGEARKAPDIILRDYQGREVRTSDFHGRPLIMISWVSWCPFCRDELKDFAAVKNELGDKAVMIAINRAESREIAMRYTDNLGTSNDLIFLLDPDDSFYRSVGGVSMPEIIFVDRDGLVRYRKRGPESREELRRRIEDLVQR